MTSRARWWPTISLPFLVDPVGCCRARIFGILPFSAALCDATYGISPYGDRSIERVQSSRKVWLPSTRSYLASLTERPREPALFKLAAGLFELQRTGYSMTLRKGESRFGAPEKPPIARDKNLGDSLAARITPLLLRSKSVGSFSNSLANCSDQTALGSQLVARLSPNAESLQIQLGAKSH